MTQPLRHVGPRERLIRHVGPREPRLEPADIARALGAEPTNVTIPKGLGPITLFAVRAELFKRLQSSGGRPALEGTTRRAKIPLSDAEWQQLEQLATTISTAGFAPSAGQVASVLLTAALTQLAAPGAPQTTVAQPGSPLAQTLATLAARVPSEE